MGEIGIAPRHAPLLTTLKEQGTWAWEQKPLLDEYVFALIGAKDARRGFKWLDALERTGCVAPDRGSHQLAQPRQALLQHLARGAAGR